MCVMPQGDFAAGDRCRGDHAGGVCCSVDDRCDSPQEHPRRTTHLRPFLIRNIDHRLENPFEIVGKWTIYTVNSYMMVFKVRDR